MKCRKLFLNVFVLLFVILCTGCTRVVEKHGIRWIENRDSVLSRSAKPAENVYVFDAFGVDQRTKTLLNTAQGMINRDQPKLYLILQKPSATAAEMEKTHIKHDLNWLKWLKQNDYIKRTTELSSPAQVLETFDVKDVVLVDDDLPVGLNIATMAAAVNNAAVAYPEHVEKFGLNVILDMRGRFNSNLDAYRWAFENLWPKMNKTAIACLAPKPELSHMRDYLVAKKIFTVWPTGPVDGDNKYSDPPAEKEYTAQMLSQMPVNIPVIGYPWAGKGVGIGEGDGVKLFSKYAKFLVPMDWKANLSLWTGLEAKLDKFENVEPRKMHLENDRAYITLIISDGDNLNTWYDYFPEYWQSSHRGRIPIGWAMGPALLDVQPPLLDYYYSTLTHTDSIGVAVSGIGYMYPSHYAQAWPGQRQPIVKQFMNLTERYMQKLDMHWIWIFDKPDETPEYLIDYTRYIDNLNALFPGYGSDVDYNKANYLLNGIPVFHAVNRGRDPEKLLGEIIESTPKKAPAFMYVFLHNWSFTSDDIANVMNQLPEKYKLVRPEQLTDLYLQYRKSR